MAINEFDISVFGGKSDLSHLYFRSDFKFSFNENNIIFAFNGVCKTSITRFLVNNYSNQFFVINYEDNKDKIKAVKENKKIEILPDIFSLQQAKNDLEQVKQSLNLFKRIENGFGILKGKIDASNIQYLKDAKDNDTINAISLTEIEFNEINSILEPIKKPFGFHFEEIYNGTHDVNREISDMQ